MNVVARTAIFALAAFALAGCAAGRWERGSTSAAETDTILAECRSVERAHTTTFNYPYIYRTRDGRSEVLLMPDRVVAPGRDVDSCMRRQGFVRAAVAAPQT
ncbi:MAG: hypothetical protein ACKO1J_08360 [Tagaea sp.]